MIVVHTEYILSILNWHRHLSLLNGFAQNIPGNSRSIQLKH